MGLSPCRRLCHHLCLLFLESLPDSFTSCHELLHTAGDAAGLALDQGFGGEVVDTGVEAVSNEVGEHLRRMLVIWWKYWRRLQGRAEGAFFCWSQLWCRLNAVGFGAHMSRIDRWPFCNAILGSAELD